MAFSAARQEIAGFPRPFRDLLRAPRLGELSPAFLAQHGRAFFK
jgi:hypothetical protein